MPVAARPRESGKVPEARSIRRAQMIETMVAQPLDTDGSYAARITSIEQVDDAATATIEEDGGPGVLSFTDFFTLARIDGSWKIANKTFAHTGGEMPAE